MSQTKQRFMTEEAYEALMHKHQCHAVNGFISGDLSRIDPNFGTALCQIYSLVNVNYCHEVQNALRAAGRLDAAQALVADFNQTTAKSEKGVTQVKSPEDVWNNGKPTKDYLGLFNAVSNIVGEDAVEFAGFCVSLTAMAALSRDEVDIAFSRRPMQAYYVSTPAAEKSKNFKDCVNKEAGIKFAVAKYAHDYMQDLAKDLAGDGYDAASKGTGTVAYHNFFNQLAASTAHMVSTVPNPGGPDMPVMAIYNSILLILIDQHRRGQPIVERIRRIAKRQLPSDDDEEGSEKDVDVDVQPQSVNKFQDAVVVLWQPDPATGLFKKTAVTDANKNTACVVFDAISVFNGDNAGEGLLSSDLATFLNCVGEIGLEPRALHWAAGHPKFSAKALAGSPNYLDAYAAFCQRQERRFAVTPERIEGLRLNPQRDGDVRIGLAALFEGSCQAAMMSNLVKYKPILGGASPSDVYVRNSETIGTTYEHIYPGTPAQMQTRCDGIKGRHAATSGAEFGNFIVRSGSGALSFIDRFEAERVNKVKSDKKKLEEHAALHKELEALRI